jgi:hypothetical protein
VTSALRWLERLSLDAVLVAVVWAEALARAAGHGLDAASLTILALATWLTYVADRLWDVRPGRPVPDTDRHRFYHRNFRAWVVVWLAAFPATVVLAIVSLPPHEVAWGWAIAAVVVAYLLLLGVDLADRTRLVLKRTAVPLIFTAGVGWMASSWTSRNGLLATVVLLCGTLLNVGTIALWEHRPEALPAAVAAVDLMAFGGLCGLAIVGIWGRNPAGYAAATAAIGYLVVYRRLRRWAGGIRVISDLALAAAGLVLLVAAS